MTAFFLIALLFAVGAVLVGAIAGACILEARRALHVNSSRTGRHP